MMNSLLENKDLLFLAELFDWLPLSTQYALLCTCKLFFKTISTHGNVLKFVKLFHKKSPFVIQSNYKSSLPSHSFLSKCNQFNGTELSWNAQKWKFVFSNYSKEEIDLLVDFILPKFSFHATDQICKIIPMVKQIKQKCKEKKPCSMEEIQFSTLTYPFLKYYSKNQKSHLLRNEFLVEHLFLLWKDNSQQIDDALLSLLRCSNTASLISTLSYEVLQNIKVQQQLLWFQFTAEHIPLALLHNTNFINQLVHIQHKESEKVVDLLVQKMVKHQIPIASMQLVESAIKFPNCQIDPKFFDSEDFLIHYGEKFLHDRTIVKKLYNNHAALKRFLIIHPSSLIYAPKELCKDREFMITCIRQWGNCLEYCDEEMRSDLEVCTLAVSTNFGALIFVSKELQSHPQIVAAYNKRWSCVK